MPSFILQTVKYVRWIDQNSVAYLRAKLVNISLQINSCPIRYPSRPLLFLRTIFTTSTTLHLSEMSPYTCDPIPVEATARSRLDMPRWMIAICNGFEAK